MGYKKNETMTMSGKSMSFLLARGVAVVREHGDWGHGGEGRLAAEHGAVVVVVGRGLGPPQGRRHRGRRPVAVPPGSQAHHGDGDGVTRHQGVPAHGEHQPPS